MNFHSNFESDEIFNVSKLTAMDLPCEAHIVYQNRLWVYQNGTWVKKAMTIKIVRWNREFMFDIKHISDKSIVLKNKTHASVFDELLNEILQKKSCSTKMTSISQEIRDMVTLIDETLTTFYSPDTYSNVMCKKTAWIIIDALISLRGDLITLYNNRCKIQ